MPWFCRYCQFPHPHSCFPHIPIQKPENISTADDAKKDGADILEPTTDTVKYSDGTTDEVYGFDVPVEALDEEFDLAILGTKGEWYDHKVSVSDPQETDN